MSYITAEEAKTKICWMSMASPGGHCLRPCIADECIAWVWFASDKQLGCCGRR